MQSCLSISRESSSSDGAPCPLTSEHPLLAQLPHPSHYQQAAMGTSDGESDNFSTSSNSPVMLDSVSPTEQLPPGSASSCGSAGGMGSHFPWMPPAVSHSHFSHPFSGMLFANLHSHHTFSHSLLLLLALGRYSITASLHSLIMVIQI